MKTLREVVIAVALVLLFAPLGPAQAINIWQGAKCGGTPIGPTGGPQGPCTFCDALVVTQNIIKLLLEFATIAATVMIVVGALMMMFAAGSEERFATGKKTILNAVIGLAIALASWLIVNILLQFLSGTPNLPWNQINCT
jgi:hypothetical protein